MLAAVLGPTGAGKSLVGMLVAEGTGAEIVSVDSMQVYRRMDIGTAKASHSDRARVRHHMIDIVEPSEAYSVAAFRDAAREAMRGTQRPLLIVGGSGLHFRSLVDPLDFAPADPAVRQRLARRSPDELVASLLEADPDASTAVDLRNPRRVTRALEIFELTGATPSERATSERARAVRAYESEVPVVAIGIDPGARLRERIEQRVDRMLEQGLLAEVADLIGEMGVTAAGAVGYGEMARVVRGEWSLEEGRRRTIDATTALARRQRTYFRRDPRITWLEWDDDPARLADGAMRLFEEAEWSS